MTDKPNRRWFQIHLSTAIVLMFVAGGLLAINLKPHQETWIGFEAGPALDEVYYYDQMAQCYSGWPMVCRSTEGYVSNRQSVDASLAIHLPTPSLRLVKDVERMWPELYRQLKLQKVEDPGLFSSKWNFTNLLINFTVCTAILVLVAIGSEYIIRRREARKP